MATDTVQLIFQIQAQNTATLGTLRQSIGAINTTLQEHLKLTQALVIRSSEQIRQNNEIITSLNNKTNAQKNNNEAVSGSIIKGILYAEILNRVLNTIKEVTVESALYAARTQQLNVIMDQLARVNGLSVPAVRQTADAVKSLGITTQESREVINRMIFAQLDLTKATDLARLSQNAAKIAGVSSSEALSGIINGIVEQRVQILRTYGIQVQFEQALIRGAAALHKTRDTLTDYERANIALNEVLSKAPRIYGTYEVSLSTAAGQMQSMKRYVDEARNALGEGFIPILQRVIGLLTDGTRSVQDNAEAYSSLAKHITAASLAITAAKLTPGGPLPKAIAGAVVGIGAEFLFNVDAVEQQTTYNKDAIERLQKQRVELAKKFKSGALADKQEYLIQDKQLNDLQLQIEANFTEGLAKIFAKRQENAKKDLESSTFHRGARGAPISTAGVGPQIPEQIDLGAGRSVTRAQIQAAIGNIGKVPEIKPGDLTIRPDVGGQFDAILGQFTTKVKEAKKTAEGGLDRAKEGLLSGSEKIEQQRRDALNRLATDFKQFTDVFKDTLSRLGEVKGDKERATLEQNIKKAQSEYGIVVARTNKQFDLELEKDRRNDAIKEINRNKKTEDVQAEINIQATRDKAKREAEVATARKPFLFPGEEEGTIKSTYEDKIAAARKEYDYAIGRAKSDLDSAERVNRLAKDDEKLNDAIAAKRDADSKAEAKLAEEKRQAETQQEVQLLELRRKRREFIQQETILARETAQEEVKVTTSRVRDAAERAVRLAQAKATPGDEQYAFNLGISARVTAAQQDYETSQANIKEQQAAATKLFIEGGLKQEEFERTIVALRKQSLTDAYALEKVILDARLDKEIQIAEIRKAQDQELRQTLGTLFDTLINHQPFSQFLRDYAKNIGRQIFQNFGTEALRGTLQAFGGIIPGQQEIDPLTGKPTGKLTTVGKIFQGTPLGIDPVKLAQAQQINALDRNTKALDDLNGALRGKTGPGIPGSDIPGSGGSTPGSSKIGGILGTIFGGSTGGLGGAGGLIIKNFNGAAGGPFTNNGFPGGGFPGGGAGGPFILNGFPGGGTNSPLGALGGAGAIGLGQILRPIPKGFEPDKGFGKIISAISPKYDPATGKAVFSPGYTALAAAAAVPGIISGIQQGGFKGITGAIGSGLGAAASIPGPQQPFLAAAALTLSLVSSMFGKSRYQKWQENLQNRLAAKWQLPESINMISDLAGNSIDYDYRGNARAFSGQPSTTFNVNVQTMDAKSFMDNAPQIAEATRSAVQLGHPLRDTIMDMTRN